MTLKAVAGGQINNAKMLTDEAAPKNKTAQSAFNPTATVPLTADRQFGANFLGGLNRARLEQKFSEQQIQPDNKEIGGVTTETSFPLGVDKTETQESVLRRTFEQYAFRAGLSDKPLGEGEKSPAQSFVEDRMAGNKKENGGEYRIFNPDTGKTYADDWAARRQDGAIRMKPTAEDIDSLKTFRSVSDYNDGTRAADALNSAVDAGWDIFSYKPFSSESVPPNVARALEVIKSQQGNESFQNGLINRLDADKFLKAEKYLSETPYKDVMRNSLAAVSDSDEVISEDGKPASATVSQRIAQKADVETLARLTNDPNKPMSRDFLVEAGKRVTTPGVGWIQSEAKSGQILSWDTVSAKSEAVFAAIGRSPEASAELLNDAGFVKNGLRMSNMTDMESTSKIRNFDQIITAGTSAEAREKNPEKVEKAIITLAEIIGNADSYRPQDLPRISADVIGAPREKVVSEETANALAKVVEENAQAFLRGAQSDETENGKLDKKDVQNIFTAISQYENPKRNLEASVSSQVAKLMTESASFSNQKTEKPREIGLLLDTLVKADKSASLKNASDEDKKIEMATNLFNDVAGLIPFGDMPMQGLTKLAMASAQRRATDIAKSGTTGTYADIEKGNLENKESKLNVVISRSTLKAYEQAAYTTLNDKNSSSDAKSKAAQFIQDIKSYNEALPDNEKVLDGSGKLVDPNAPATSGGQRINMNRLAQGGINYDNKLRAEDASRRIGDIVQPTAETIQSKVKTSYIPR